MGLMEVGLRVHGEKCTEHIHQRDWRGNSIEKEQVPCGAGETLGRIDCDWSGQLIGNGDQWDLFLVQIMTNTGYLWGVVGKGNGHKYVLRGRLDQTEQQLAPV